MKNKNLNLIYIGNEFYIKSNTMMSCIYEYKTHKRYDWGFVNIALNKGIKVTIRPANKKELLYFEKKLKSY